MALTQSLTKYGATFASAYHRVSELRYHVSEYLQTSLIAQEPDENGDPVPPITEQTWAKDSVAHFTLLSYVDEAAREAHSEALLRREFSFTPDWESADNVLAQAYAYLKTTDEFDEAVDC